MLKISLLGDILARFSASGQKWSVNWPPVYRFVGVWLENRLALQSVNWPLVTDLEVWGLKIPTIPTKPSINPDIQFSNKLFMARRNARSD